MRIYYLKWIYNGPQLPFHFNIPNREWSKKTHCKLEINSATDQHKKKIILQNVRSPYNTIIRERVYLNLQIQYLYLHIYITSRYILSLKPQTEKVHEKKAICKANSDLIVTEAIYVTFDFKKIHGHSSRHILYLCKRQRSVV